MAASDGGIFAFGDAGFFGSTGAIKLSKRIQQMAATPTGKGYWMVAGDGGIFAFGDAAFYGSAVDGGAEKRIVDMAPSATGKGYYITASNGAVYAYGDAKHYGGPRRHRRWPTASSAWSPSTTASRRCRPTTISISCSVPSIK